MAPLRTPSPGAWKRSQSLDSARPRLGINPTQESPFSKSSGAISSRSIASRVHRKKLERVSAPILNAPLPLHTKISNESMLSGDSLSSSSTAVSSVNSDTVAEISTASLSSAFKGQEERPHSLTCIQAVDPNRTTPSKVQPPSPFLYRDFSYPMHSPWLVRIVLDLYDIRGLDWMFIAEPVGRLWYIQTSSAEVLDILNNNGRVSNRCWWD